MTERFYGGFRTADAGGTSAASTKVNTAALDGLIKTLTAKVNGADSGLASSLADIEANRVKTLAEGRQSLVSKGLYNTTMDTSLANALSDSTERQKLAAAGESDRSKTQLGLSLASILAGIIQNQQANQFRQSQTGFQGFGYAGGTVTPFGFASENSGNSGSSGSSGKKDSSGNTVIQLDPKTVDLMWSRAFHSGGSAPNLFS